MTRNSYDVGCLDGERYEKLIHFAASRNLLGLLVVRDEELSTSGEELLCALRTKPDRASEWPGTRLLRDTATIHRFRVTPDASAQLLRVTNSVCDWQQPELPEDLAVLRQDESLFFGSIAHEKDSWLEISEEERVELGIV